MRKVLITGLWVLSSLGACTEADYTQTEGEWAGEDDGLGDDESADEAGPELRPGLSATERCVAFEEELGDARIEADVAALLGDDSITLTVAHAETATRACRDTCSDAWLVGMELPLTQQGSFDLASNDVVGNFTLPFPHDGKCDCLSGHGLAGGTVELVAISPEVVCGWLAEDELFGIQGGFSVRVLDLD